MADVDALDNAMKALNALTKNDLTEIKSFSKPPRLVQTVMEAVCVMKGVKPDWVNSKKQLSDSKFLASLIDYDKDSIMESTLKKLKKYTDMEDFNPEKVGKVSSAAKGLCMWCCAMAVYAGAAPHADALKAAHPAEWATFDKLDVDNSGALDKDEIWCKLSVKGDEFATQMMGMVDKNGDGVVDFEEFCAAFKEIPDFGGLVSAEMSGAFIELKDLKVKCEEAFKAGKIPFIVDPSGKADSFLTYNGNDLDAKGLFVLDKIHKKKTPEEISEEFRKFCVTAMSYGQNVNLKCGKAAPALGDHVAAVGGADGIFKAGFCKDEPTLLAIIKDDEKEAGHFYPKGDWDKYGTGLVISTQFEREDYKEFLSGSWPDWPWGNFMELCVKVD